MNKVLGNSSYIHRGGEYPLLGATIPEHVCDIARRFPKREALVSVHQKRRLTYEQLFHESRKLARGLLSLGLKKGDRVGIWASNHAEWVIVQLATSFAGTILVNINPAYQRDELAYALNKSRVHTLFIMPGFRGSDYAATIHELIAANLDNTPTNLQSNTPFLKNVILFDPDTDFDRPKPDIYKDFIGWQELLDAGNEITEAQLDERLATLDRDDPVNIQYTSGTTGTPKAVILSHHNILNNAWFTAKAMRFSEQDRLCVAVPFYHCFGMVLCNLLCLSVGACLVLPDDQFDAQKVLAAVDQEKCTALHGVPTMFVAELALAEFDNYDLSSLRTGIVAGAPCSPALMEKIIWDMNCRNILIGYGQTEASPLTHLTSYQDTLAKRITTVGQNLPHQEVKIVDLKNGHTAPLDEAGEICFRGYHIMRGYYGDESATREVLDAGKWLHSGDIGTMDKEGYLQVTGRLKDMIIRGGENIYPREIEDLLHTHPAVAEAAVFALPDDYYGEEVAVWIKLRDGYTIEADEIRNFCREKLAHFKIPKYLWFVEQFPMTVTGKIQKFRMRDVALEVLSQERAYHE